MPHVVTQSCCSDASCTYACPVNCIHPTPDEPDFRTAEMLYIDPAECVDCGACVSACPVDAIKHDSKLTESESVFLNLNADFYRTPRPRPLLAPPIPSLQVRSGRELRVAIVGSGPAAMYAADEILTIPGARVRMYERLNQPYGLARFGVAPDHQRTRGVTRQFDTIRENSRLELILGAEVGVDVSHEDLLETHHAVIYAVGACTDRGLEIPGAELSSSATEFVAWYNGHPDFAGRSFDLSGPTAVVIGNGNVALDVARILTMDPEALAGTDIAPYALDALRRSMIQEVTVAGRRGPEQSAFTVGELAGLCSTPGVDVVTPAEHLDALPASDPRAEILRNATPRAGSRNRRVVLDYLLSPIAVDGAESACAARFVRNELVPAPDGSMRVKSTGEQHTIDAGLVLTSTGYRGVPVPGLPFDGATGTVPNISGQVRGLDRTYVAGWIKRGANGFIGTNKSCAQETVRSLIDEYNAGPSLGANV